METRWKTIEGSPTIRRVECRVATCFVYQVVKGKWSKEAINSQYHKYHETFDAAKRYLIGTNTAQLKQVRKMLEKLEDFERKILALEETNCDPAVHGGAGVCLQATDGSKSSDTLSS